MTNRNTIRTAEIMSVLGAGVLGAGIVLAVPAWFLPKAGWLLAVGLITHSVGMYTKHRAENLSGLRRAGWEEPFYWFCWLTLAALAGYLLLKAVAG